MPQHYTNTKTLILLLSVTCLSVSSALAQRVSDQLVALYDMSSGSGNTVVDQAGSLDLTIASGAGWLSGGGLYLGEDAEVSTAANAGTYGEIDTQGPFPISNGAFNMVIQDVEDSSCTTSVSIQPTETCFSDCVLIIDLISVDCDDQGTEDDTSDDVFIYTISVDAVNATGGWTASDGTSGAFGETVTSVGHDYSEGEIEITITDNEEACYNTFTITPPRAGLICPEDTDQRSYFGNVQRLSGNLGVGDTTVSAPLCFLTSSSIPMTFGDRIMVSH